MEWIIYGVIIIVILSFFGGGKKKKRSVVDFDDKYAWLIEKWQLEKAAHKAGLKGSNPPWHFDDVSERQITRIEETKFDINPSKLTKGQASDVIGLTEQAEEEQKDILRFFKVPMAGMNQTLAQYKITEIFNDSDNKEKWNNRPADPVQKEFFRFFGIKVPKGITINDATKLMVGYEPEDSASLDNWEHYEAVIEELHDAEERELYEIKKPSITLIRKGFDKMLADGETYSDIRDSVDDLVDVMIEIKPDLKK